MRCLKSLSAITALVTGFLVYACSTSGNNNLAEEGAGGSASDTSASAFGSTPNGSSQSSSTGSSTSKGTGNGLGSSIDIDQAKDPDADVCAAADQPAELTPVYMVFIYDTSGSMGDDPKTERMNASSRWEPMKLGMIDFFKNSGTIGIKASLEYFPAPGDKAQTCRHDYRSPAVPMTSLETPEALISSLNNRETKGGTPTLPAVMGGIGYARELMAKNEGSRAVVVLVTDGEPAIYNSATGETETDCVPIGFEDKVMSDGQPLANTIGHIAEVVGEAYAEDPPIQTYVIGIGEVKEDMAAIAAKGGTEFIKLNAGDDAEVTRNKLTTALQSIRTTQFQCTMPIPKTADYDSSLVNVKFKHSDGKVVTFGKSVGCAKKMGWDFADDGNHIELCEDTCSAIQQDTAGSMQIQLGCKTLIL